MSELPLIGLNPQARAANWLAGTLSAAITEAFRILIETKHLYQSVHVDGPPSSRWQELLTALPESDRARFEATPATLLLINPWIPSFGQDEVLQRVAMPDGLHFEPPDVRLLCGNCKDLMAFEPMENYRFRETPPSRSARQFGMAMPETSDQTVARAIQPRPVQLFGIPYACTYCKAKEGAVGFLIRREREKLTLCGRAPIAQFRLPSFLPKTEEGFYRDAIIAYQAGQVLPGLFMLRTFIEQFARRLTGINNTSASGDELFVSYGKGLPAKYRATMVSLGEWYRKLSVALHSAEARGELFELARIAIEKHFEQRRVNDIPEAVPAKPGASRGKESARAVDHRRAKGGRRTKNP